MGGFGTALLGAILGTIVGAGTGASGKSNSEDAPSAHAPSGGPAQDVATRLAELERNVGHIYKSLEDIHWRLNALEKPGEQREPRPDMPGSVEITAAQSASDSLATEVVAPPAAEVSPMPAVSSQRSELTVEQAVAMEGLDAAPLKDEPFSEEASPQADSNTAPEKPIPEPERIVSEEPDRKWLIGLCVGGVLGMMGGFSTMVLGAKSSARWPACWSGPFWNFVDHVARRSPCRQTRFERSGCTVGRSRDGIAGCCERGLFAC